MTTPYGEQFQREKAKAQFDAEREQAERDAENEKARLKWLAHLDAKRAEEHLRHEAEIDASLEGEKLRTRVAWLAGNCNLTEADFERSWPRLRAALLQQARDESIAQTRDQLRRSGAYSL